MKIKAWAIDKAKGIICKDCQTCAELEKQNAYIRSEYEGYVDHWIGQYQDAFAKMDMAQERCEQLQKVIGRLCQGYDAMAMAVEGMKHGKE